MNQDNKEKLRAYKSANIEVKNSQPKELARLMSDCQFHSHRVPNSGAPSSQNRFIGWKSVSRQTNAELLDQFKIILEALDDINIEETALTQSILMTNEGVTEKMVQKYKNFDLKRLMLASRRDHTLEEAFVNRDLNQTIEAAKLKKQVRTENIKKWQQERDRRKMLSGNGVGLVVEDEVSK